MPTKTKIFNRLDLLAAFYACAFIFQPILSGGRDINVFGYPVMPGSILALLSLSTLSVIQFNYGREKARSIVYSSIIARVMVWGFVLGTMYLPELAKVQGYDRVVNLSFRVLIASIVSRYVGVLMFDMPIFQKIKEKTGTFSLSYIGALMTEHLVAGTLFILISKYGIDHNLIDRFIGGSIVRFAGILLMAPLFTLINYMCTEAKDDRTCGKQDSNN